MTDGKDEMVDPNLVPPREIPPAEWPLHKQMLSYRKWTIAQGGMSTEDMNIGWLSGDKDGGSCPDCGDSDPPKKIYREHFSPPLRDVDPETVPADDLSSTIEFYRQRFLEQGDFLNSCEHLSRREILRWIRDIAQRRYRISGRTATAIFQPTETCPVCNRPVIQEICEDRGKTLLEYSEGKIESIIDLMDRVDQHLDRRSTDAIWPPGTRRLNILARTTVERLKHDIAGENVPVLEEDEKTMLKVISGIEALSWVTSGINDLYEDASDERVMRCLRGGARMIRILDYTYDQPGERPGRLYDDLCSILPDVEFIVELLDGDDHNDVEDHPDFPDPSSESPEAWQSIFLEELARENPSFSTLLLEGVSRDRVDAAHRKWIRREHNRSVRDKRSKRFIQNAFGRSVQFDPDNPNAFLDGTVEPVDPSDVDPTHFDNAALMAFFMSGDDGLSSDKLRFARESEENDSTGEPDGIDRDVQKDFVYRAVQPLREKLHNRWTSTNREEASPVLTALYHLVEWTEDLHYRARIYQRSVDHRVPIEGAQRGVDLLLKRCESLTRLEEGKFAELETIIAEIRQSIPELR